MAKTSPDENNQSYSKIGYTTPVAEHPSLDEVYEETPFSEEFWTYLNYVILNIFGWFRDLLRSARIENRKGSAENNPPVRKEYFVFYFDSHVFSKRVLYHFIKVMKVFILEMFINVLPIVLIGPLGVYQVANSIYLNVLLMIITGHLRNEHIFNTMNSILMFHLSFTGKKIKTINLGSYNYLGFANNNGPIAENVINSIKVNGVAAASTAQEFGNYIFKV
jgi:serine palmitoyltransferase